MVKYADQLAAMFDMNAEQADFTRLLVNDERDYNEFIAMSEGKRNCMFSLTSFRLMRLAYQNMTFDQFEQDYNQAPHRAIERLFLHPINNSDVVKLKQYLNAGCMTLKSLFYYHMEHKADNFCRVMKKLATLP